MSLICNTPLVPSPWSPIHHPDHPWSPKGHQLYVPHPQRATTPVFLIPTSPVPNVPPHASLLLTCHHVPSGPLPRVRGPQHANSSMSLSPTCHQPRVLHPQCAILLSTVPNVPPAPWLCSSMCHHDHPWSPMCHQPRVPHPHCATSPCPRSPTCPSVRPPHSPPPRPPPRPPRPHQRPGLHQVRQRLDPRGGPHQRHRHPPLRGEGGSGRRGVSGVNPGRGVPPSHRGGAVGGSRPHRPPPLGR